MDRYRLKARRAARASRRTKKEKRSKKQMKIDLSNYEQINIYNASGVIFSTVRGGFERAEIDGERAKSYYKNVVYNIELPAERIRSARKLNLEKGDIFDISYIPQDRYTIRNGRALYIPAELVAVRALGEFLAMEANGEKNYLTIYKFEFCAPQSIDEPQILRIICDNYTLQPGERFGEYYGADEAHACVAPFDSAKYAERRGIPAEKGIIKRWLSPVVYNSFIVKSDYYTRTEKDSERLEREKIADIINACLYNKSVSHYDIAKMLEKLNISIK
jgi:hypothetical protein